MQHLIHLGTQALIESDEFRKLNPNVSLPHPLTPEVIVEYCYGLYQQTEKPAPAWNQKVLGATPVADVNGVYQQTWEVVDLTGDELGAAQYMEAQRVKDEIVAREQYQQDTFAKSKGYDDIKSATGYAGCDFPKFDIEGTYCKNVRSRRWARLYEIMGEVVAGVRPMPATHAEIDGELPPMIWPAEPVVAPVVVEPPPVVE